MPDRAPERRPLTGPPRTPASSSKPARGSGPDGRQPETQKREERFRRRKRANTGCLSGLLYGIVIIGVSFLLASFGWVCANDVLALMKDPVEVEFNVPESFTIPSIAAELKEKGVIKYAWLFNLYCSYSHAEEKIVPGKFVVSSGWDYRALVTNMGRGSEHRLTVRITLREGLTADQILSLLAENEVASIGLLREAESVTKYGYSFLADLPYGPNRLEGYLYPDTYDFYIGEDPDKALKKLLANFDRKLTAEYRSRAENMDYSLHDIVIIASMIEAEATDDVEDRKNIASVIYNRLERSDSKKLQVDATIQYILPQRVPRLGAEELAIDSPYNTYLYAGLPPGPICNPSIDAIRAALYPSRTDYFFYALTKDGSHKFSKTLKEHQQVMKDNPEIYGG